MLVIIISIAIGMVVDIITMIIDVTIIVVALIINCYFDWYGPYSRGAISFDESGEPWEKCNYMVSQSVTWTARLNRLWLSTSAK